MPRQRNERTVTRVPSALRCVGLFAGTWAIFVGLAATLAYLPGHPEFSFFTTYLSDIGDTAGWPQILWNSGTLLAAPIRYLFIVLLVLRLGALGAGRAFAASALVVGAISTSGTVLMTAVPFSVGPAIHKLGIPLYFLGAVLLQTLIGVCEW